MSLVDKIDDEHGIRAYAMHSVGESALAIWRPYTPMWLVCTSD